MLQKLQIHTFLYWLLFFTILSSCQDTTQSKKTPLNSAKTNSKVADSLPLTYATGFSITENEHYKVLTINNPWPNAQKQYKYVLLEKNQDRNNIPESEQYTAIITVPITKIVVTSTTHIPALELLEEENALIGFPGTDYISSQKTRQLIASGAIRELGKTENLNTEVLLELFPEVVIGFGIDNNNQGFETIQKAGIPVIYNGDWVENSPLAKAEWIKFFGALFNKGAEANRIFKTIETNYLEAKELAKNTNKNIQVLSGAMHKDIWYLPSGNSPEAQLLRDANLNSFWKNSTNKGSLALSFEVVFDTAKNADLWISPSYYNSFSALQKANAHYTKFKPFKENKIYSFVNTTGSTGGVTYYELGTARPDLVLKDLVKIAHPELLVNYELQFFKPLQ
ncbi:ABC transporter substrate-binding protein [Bizionia sediminis]|uniref:ABC transporter substrate-binding protein n=1 Tax=Bizionia sediminis TaxID=1737064 RepID=A0ABW5KNP4_9FLAO